MSRRVFFSFHYQRDIWRVNVVRNSNIVEGSAAAGFQDASLWEKARAQGDRAVRQLIDQGLQGTSVTVVLIGAETATRRYVKYEIEKSIERGNGLLGIYIDQIRDENGNTSHRGAQPDALRAARASCYAWDPARFGEWVEQAAKAAGR